MRKKSMQVILWETEILQWLIAGIIKMTVIMRQLIQMDGSAGYM